MTLSFESTHEYYIKDPVILWCKDHDGLVITQDWNDSVRFSGIDQETIKKFINGVFKNYPELAKEFRETPKEEAETSSTEAG